MKKIKGKKIKRNTKMLNLLLNKLYLGKKW